MLLLQWGKGDASAREQLIPLVHMAAKVTARGAEFDVGERTPLFRTDVAPSVGWRYDVARDGRRFPLNASSGQEGRTPITLVINWTEQPAKR